MHYVNTTQFWLIRHGETQWNAEKRLQGWLDIPLSEVGLQQARRLGGYLRSASFSTSIDLVIASDQGRAYETAVRAASRTRCPIARPHNARERYRRVDEGHYWACV